MTAIAHRPIESIATAIATLLVAVLLAGPAPAQTAPSVGFSSTVDGNPTFAAHGEGSRAVAPIDWSDFDRTSAAHPAAAQLRAILLNSNRYALTTWWEQKGYDSQTGDYLDLGALAGPAYEAFALSVSLATGAYDPADVGVPIGQARTNTLKLVRALAAGHRVNDESAGWWGGRWQDALWAANTAYAGWMLWDGLPAVDRENVRRMVEWEANRLRDADVPYYRDESGAIIRPGDTAAEENAWNAMLMQVATAMMPDHPSWKRWMDRNLELMLSAYSRPGDVGGDTVVNGKRLGVWLNGSNIESNGMVINHSQIHPDYMTSFDFNLMAGSAYTLAGKETPRAAFFNADVVYDALVDAEFPSPPYVAPGGTMYIDGSSDIYYPEGTDWSPTRRMIFAEVDAMARAYGLDGQASREAAYWEELHAGAALAQQERHPDGKMYAPGEFTSEENDGAAYPARAYLTDWLTRQGLVEVTNRAYPVPPEDRAPATLSLDAPADLRTGQTVRVRTTLDNRTQPILTRSRMQLEVPEGWSAQATSPAEFGRIGEGEEVTTTWDVTAPEDADAGLAEIQARASYRALGRSESVERTARVWVIPNDRINPQQITAMASDFQSPYPPSRVLDDDVATIWHNQYRPPAPAPHSITLELGGVYDVTALHYQPRLDSPNGVITAYKVYASADGATFAEVAAGDWPLDHESKRATFSAPGARYIRLEAVAGWGGYASAAELMVTGAPASG